MRKPAIAIGVISLAAGILAAERGGYDSHGKRNPFLPSSMVTPLAGVSGLDVDTKPLQEWFAGNLGGILWDEESPHALVGDRIVSVGSEIRGCRIVEIRPDGIVFEYLKKRVGVRFQVEQKETPTDENE